MMMRAHCRVTLAASGMVAAVVGWALINVAVNASSPEVTASSAEKRQIGITDTSPASKLCDHDVEDNKVTLTKNDQDELKWTVDNKCRWSQRVLLCVYRPITMNGNVTYKLENPFCKCNSDTTGADIAKVFTVLTGKKTRLKCHAVGDTATYLKQVLVGLEVPINNTCPQTPVLEVMPRHAGGKPRLHQLDIEVQP